MNTCHFLEQNSLTGEKIFLSERHYWMFIQRYVSHMNAVANTLGYCLQPEKIQLLIQPIVDLEICIKRFSSCLHTYTQSYNRVTQHKGGIFQRGLIMKELKSEEEFFQTLRQLHRSPVEEGRVQRIGEWHHSSYRHYFNPAPTFVVCERVHAEFKTEANFRRWHENPEDGRNSLIGRQIALPLRTNPNYDLIRPENTGRNREGEYPDRTLPTGMPGHQQL